MPFNDLLFAAQEVHRANFDANKVQLSTLLSIKTGGCSEDCGYCSQSHHHEGAKAKLEGLELLSVLQDSDPAYVELVIRRRLHYSKPDELIFRFDQ